MSLQDTTHFIFMEIRTASRIYPFSPKYVLNYGRFILENPSLVWLGLQMDDTYQILIRLDRKPAMFYNWWNRDLLAVPEINFGCNFVESCRNNCAS